MSMLGLVSLLSGAALRWTFLLLAAAALALGTRWLSARGRHLVWLTALVALPLLPMLRLALPVWHLDPALPVASEPAAAAPVPETPSVAPAPSAARTPRAPALPAEKTVTTPAPSFPLALVWAVVAAGLLGRLVAGHLALRRLIARARPAEDPRLLGTARNAAAMLGHRSFFELLVGDGDLVPMTWGWRRGVVLLPAAALDWSDARLRSVLVHELAHLRRRDGLSQLLANLVAALFWFHPGVFWALGQLRREAELACDDAVVAAGTSARGYAADLLELARGLRRPARLPAPALAIARTSGLEARLRTLVDPARRRREAPLARGLTLALLGGLGLGLAAWGGASAAPRSLGADQLEKVGLESGRTAWRLPCAAGSGEACHDTERKALALLSKTGKPGVVVVQEVASGELLAYVSVAAADTDAAQAVPLLPSASVAKLALAALWWEDGLADRQLPCPSKLTTRGGIEVRAVLGRDGAIEVPHQMIVLSCNTAGASMAEELLDRHGAGELRGRFERFGFTGGDERTLADWQRDWPLLAVGAGNLATTPIAVSGLLQAIGNDGRRLEPSGVGTPAGASEQLFSAATAQKLRRSMASVITEGTAQRVQPQLEWTDWKLGGKTGTLMREGTPGDGWFAGLAYAPDGKAAFTVVVYLEGAGGGGGPAAGIAAEMTRFLARRVGGEL